MLNATRRVSFTTILAITNAQEKHIQRTENVRNAEPTVLDVHQRDVLNAISPSILKLESVSRNAVSDMLQSKENVFHVQMLTAKSAQLKTNVPNVKLTSSSMLTTNVLKIAVLNTTRT